MERNYFLTIEDILESEELSWKEKAIIVYIKTNAAATMKELIEASKDGKHAVRATVDALMEKGLVEKSGWYYTTTVSEGF